MHTQRECSRPSEAVWGAPSDRGDMVALCRRQTRRGRRKGRTTTKRRERCHPAPSFQTLRTAQPQPQPPPAPTAARRGVSVLIHVYGVTAVRRSALSLGSRSRSQCEAPPCRGLAVGARQRRQTRGCVVNVFLPFRRRRRKRRRKRRRRMRKRRRRRRKRRAARRCTHPPDDSAAAAGARIVVRLAGGKQHRLGIITAGRAGHGGRERGGGER